MLNNIKNSNEKIIEIVENASELAKLESSDDIKKGKSKCLRDRTRSCIVKRVIELQGGNVGVTVNPYGKVSVFWVTVKKADKKYNDYLNHQIYLYKLCY